jgi:hypothetical protein
MKNLLPRQARSEPFSRIARQRLEGGPLVRP